MTDPAVPSVTLPAPDPDILTAGRLTYRWDADVATITLNLPERRNAQLPETWEALRHIYSRLPSQTRMVVLRGAGPSFSAGLDLAAFAPTPRGQETGTRSLFADVVAAPTAIADDMIARFQAGFTWLSDPAFISVAVVQGHAVGAGFQLALACDLIVATEDAQFAMAEVTRGLVPDLTGTRRLVQAVGARRALDLCITGRRLGIDEAERMGLIARRLDSADLEAGIERIVAEYTASDGDTVRAVSRLMDSASRLDVEDQLAAERSEQIHRLRALLER